MSLLERNKIRRLAAILAIAAILPASASIAQDQVRTFDQPILVLNTGGHSGPIRSLIFAENDRLISGGEDKIVRTWLVNAEDKVGDRILRPPIWRGRGGAILSMAIARPDQPGGPRTLAISGYSVHSLRGGINLYRFPGSPDKPQGDPIGELAPGNVKPGVDPGGHVRAVGCLAFDPTNPAILASGSNDGTIRLWNVATKTHLGVLRDPTQGAVNAIAFTPDGTRIVSGGTDGAVRVWDARAMTLVARSTPQVDPNDRGKVQINSLSLHPDGRQVVTGTEDGSITLYNIADPNLAGTRIYYSYADNLTGAVEAVAFSPDGTKLATSIISGRSNPTDRPTVACNVELWDFPGIRLSQAIFSARLGALNPPMSDLTYALAFSPDGAKLAIGGGADASVIVKDLANPAPPALTFNGQGRGVWDVGFAELGPDAPKEPAVAFHGSPPGAPAPSEYAGFLLKTRAPTTFRPDQVRGALTTFGQWTVRPRTPFLLDVFNNNALAFTINLTNLDERWWAYSFLPPGPGHPRPTIGVACKQGVAIYRLEDGARTRFVIGHTGPVFCLAPSGDGKWLATGGGDQAVRLTSLAGCDVPPPFGATFGVRPEGGLVVTAVTPRGFAEAGDLRVGDVVDDFAIGGALIDRDAFLARRDTAPPNVPIDFLIRRAPGAAPSAQPAQPDGRIPFLTTRRDRPSLALFVGQDNEWVLWMPQGYYDTSVAGDSTFLGWQLNRYAVGRLESSDYFPIITHEAQLRQLKRNANNLIDQLIDGANEAAVLNGADPEAPAPVVAQSPPPRVVPVLGANGAVVLGPDGAAIAPGSPLPERITMVAGVLAITWTVESDRAQPVGPFEVRVDGRPDGPAAAPPVDPQGKATLAKTYALDPGAHQVLAVARNAQAVERRLSISVDVTGPPPPPPPRGSRLKIVAIAPDFNPPIPAIDYAKDDAGDLSTFFARYAVAEAGARFPEFDRPDPKLTGPEATAERINATFQEAVNAQAGRGDVLIVVVESHMLEMDGDTKLVAADSTGVPPRGTVSAQGLATTLGSIARSGTRVIVVLDVVHPGPEPGWKADVVDWVRQLYNREGVGVVVATTRGQLLTKSVKGHRILAAAILESTQKVAIHRAPGGNKVLTLADFRDYIPEAVRRLTKRREGAAFYIPREVNAGLPLLDPLLDPR